jgi:hypothetical protein
MNFLFNIRKKPYFLRPPLKSFNHSQNPTKHILIDPRVQHGIIFPLKQEIISQARNKLILFQSVQVVFGQGELNRGFHHVQMKKQFLFKIISSLDNCSSMLC